MRESFAIIPLEVIKDGRLTHRQMRVLIALYSFCSKGKNSVWPSRSALAERCGLRLSDISTTTTQLQRLGWLTKVVGGGESKANQYQLATPGTVPESSTVPDSSTVPESSTGGYRNPVPGGTGIQYPVELRKEVTNELTNEVTKKKKGALDRSSSRFNAAESPLPDRVPREAWVAFCQYRRERRKPVTQRSATLLLNRLAKFSDPVASLEASIANGWTGVFESQQKNGGGKNGRETIDDIINRNLRKAAGID